MGIHRGQYSLFPSTTPDELMSRLKDAAQDAQVMPLYRHENNESTNAQRLSGWGPAEDANAVVERFLTVIGERKLMGPAHLVRLRELTPEHSLARWAARYLAEYVYGVQSTNTLDAKSRDLTAFVRWFVALNGTGAVERWLPRDTQAYLHHMEAQGRAASTVNRAFATLRHMARWVRERPENIFVENGLPTQGIYALAMEEPGCKKLSPSEIRRLFEAADRLVVTKLGSTQRPRRNRAILALLYYTGLRVSELVQLRRDQYDGRYLLSVKRKGRTRTKEMYINSTCRKLLTDYLIFERADALGELEQGQGALFSTHRGDQHITRRQVANALEGIAKQANEEKGTDAIHIHPHRLRHTFGAEYREKTGSDTETASALGHSSGLGYVGRYVRKTQEEREEVLDSF
jgi:site-specific recombinase XerD